jgi:hypothetical protein
MGKRRVITILFLMLFGLFPFMNSLSNPRTKGLHGADRLQLIASGLCFGVGLGILIGGRRFPGE